MDELLKAKKLMELFDKQKQEEEVSSKLASKMPQEVGDNWISPSKTEKIRTDEVIKQISGEDFVDKQRALAEASEAKRMARLGNLDKGQPKWKMNRFPKLMSKLGSGAKALPIVGPALGALSALSSGDASAAVPILNDIESTGPERGSLESRYESGEKLSPTEMQELMKKLSNK